MSRKTKPRRSTRSSRASSPRHWNVNDAPRMEERLSLVCGACGAAGRYDVGTVTINQSITKAPGLGAIKEAVGFTGYFRCRKCDAGGPWELPTETVMHVSALVLAAMSGREDVPLIFGCTATFDKRITRYATDGEAHLKKLIDREPERAFLWVRLGNLYGNGGQDERAETAYRRAIELDPKDIEAHFMLGQLLIETARPLEAVPNLHAVLENVRDARQVAKELRRNLVRGAIELLLEAHAESKGEIDLLPTMSPEYLGKRGKDEPVVLVLRDFDLGSEEGLDDLCNMFLEPPRRTWRDMFGRGKKRVSEASDDWPAAPIRRDVVHVARNARCPCGSGHKYKKCCGR
ncbi:MAG: SEC-C domain-containing protein [Planctomycetes bacterium]|nr:SEC-C domain-containing protein [Planctomycetota bacterium]